MQNRLLALFAVAAAYWLFARLGLLLAVPPGYATAVWPPSGIALGAVLVWGGRLLPGVWLGSFLANAVTAFDAASPLASLLVPAAIGLGATCQAGLAAYAIRRWVGYPAALQEDRDVLWFLALAGPLGSCVNATLSVNLLSLAGGMSWPDFAANWATWWVGDTIGCLIFTPLLLAVFGEPRAAWRMRCKSVALPLLASFAAAAALFVHARLSEDQRQAREFTQATEMAFNTVEAGIVRYSSAVWSLRGLFDASHNVERGEFLRFAVALLRREPGLQALSWNSRVTAAERQAFERAQRAGGMADFAVREQDAQGRLSPANARDEYTVVTYIEALADNREAVGYDVASEPTRRAALEQARDSGEMVATAPIALVQDAGVLAHSAPATESGLRRQSGVLLFVPVYRQGAAIADIMQRRASLAGFVVGVLRFGDMLDSVLPPPSAERRLLPLRVTDADTDAAKPLYVDAAFDGKAPLLDRRILSVGGRRWLLEASGKAADFGQNWGAWYVLAGGLLFTGLLGGVLLLLTGRTLRVESLVRERTDELAGNNERLRREIGERAKTEAALRESEARFRAMADAAPVLIWVAGADARCNYFNKGWLEFTGRAFEQELGNGWAEGVHPEDMERCLAVYLAAFAAREPFSLSYRLRRRDGAFRWVLDSGVPRFDANGEFAGYIGSGIDIGDLKQAQEDMRVAKEAAEQASRVKSQFLANMSHEIRTPMNAIMGFSALGQELAGQDEGREYFGYIHAAAENLLVVINDILDFSKVEAGELQVDSVPFDLAGLVAHATALVAPKAREKGLELAVAVTGGQGCRFSGDSQRINQVLVNLLGNAVKFTQQGRVDLQVDRIDDKDGQAWLRFAVRDTGIGIPAEDLGRLFQPFSQVDASTTRKYGGTGLGLAICRQLVNLMGGEIGVDSRPGVGSCFTFTVRVGVAVSGEQAPPADEPAARPDLQALRGHRLLLVEDNEVNLLVASKMLSRLGVEADIAHDGREALAALAARNYELVLMDVQMPVMDGLEATRRIRGDGRWPRLPIVAMTAHALLEEVRECLDVGMDDHLAKPIHGEDLARVLVKWLRH